MFKDVMGSMGMTQLKYGFERGQDTPDDQVNFGEMTKNLGVSSKPTKTAYETQNTMYDDPSATTNMATTNMATTTQYM